MWRGQVTQRQFGFKEILVVPIAGEGRYIQGKGLCLWHTHTYKIPLKHENKLRCLYRFSLRCQLPFCILTPCTLHLMHLSPTKLEECYLFLTAPHIATLHIVGVQEELTTLKGELSPIRKKRTPILPSKFNLHTKKKTKSEISSSW